MREDIIKRRDQDHQKPQESFGEKLSNDRKQASDGCCGGSCGCADKSEEAKKLADDLARHIMAERAANQLSPTNHSLLRRIELFLRGSK